MLDCLYDFLFLLIPSWQGHKKEVKRSVNNVCNLGCAYLTMSMMMVMAYLLISFD